MSQEQEQEELNPMYDHATSGWLKDIQNNKNICRQWQPKLTASSCQE